MPGPDASDPDSRPVGPPGPDGDATNAARPSQASESSDVPADDSAVDATSAPAATATPATPDAPGAPETPPLTRLGERFRIPLGIAVGVMGLALAVVFAIRPLDPAGGVRGVVDLVAGIALWAGVAAAGITWAAGAPRRVTNLCALGAIAAYVVMLFAGA